ncbi:hypothetical protein A2415_05365 [candidate division WWE3 bacterium RIFOXYC1_FULL_39_7]|uniref:Glycosyltransferase 2-like domain-containing protein n=1 Tax=candidate division WWE3 bacterium RIFOXYC1_FULL_39_7 TaxID=1802643 RepID=A0A1F4WI43_UNCKA|nr:MAG: hypothetical protein A2415_05365 [candidate division WWE3 bacterium RIFOXYC1_FULL_39_7]
MKIAGHCLVKNEARFVWFSVMSVLPYVDRILIWDTGSTDGTLEIIEEMKKTEYRVRIDFKEYGNVTKDTFWKARQDMLNVTSEDWIIMVDADEVWWDESIRKVTDEIKVNGEKLESIVVPTVNLVGDIFHFQEDKAGLYELVGRKGHLNLRGVNRKIPGLTSYGAHGVWGWVDETGKMIQDRDQKKIEFVEAPYLHASFLQRAGDLKADVLVPKRAKKLKHELGHSFPKDYFYPEAFFREKPEIVASPWEVKSKSFYARAFFETPLKKIKRRVWKAKVGY